MWSTTDKVQGKMTSDYHFVYFQYSHILHISQSCTFHILHTRISCTFCIVRLSQFSCFHTYCIFCALCVLMFFALWHALPHTSLGSITFCLHILSSSSKVHWCIFHFVSLASYHLCLCIPIYVHLSHYVFTLHHPCMFSATYSALSPGNSLSMLTHHCRVRGFHFTSLPPLTH
jgi:hypothetical protein